MRARPRPDCSRALGARDMALALGTLSAREPDALRPWLAGALAADATDLLLTLAAREHLPRRGRRLVAAVAAGAVALGAAALAGR